jgi:hypothetical protein
MIRTLIAFAGAAALASAPLAAQWLDYPTPGLPRTASGKPNLAAPVPRTPDGKPDLSGLWDAPGGKAPLMEDLAKFVEGGLPLSPWGEQLLKARLANFDKDDPDGYCQPLGLVRMHAHPYPRKIVQLPGELLILFERDNIFCQIFTDGRPMPVDPQPAFNGYSTGRWEGDILVVETAGFKDGMWLDNVGSPFTSDGKVIERFRRPSFGKLEIEVTIEDPKAYIKPWSFIVHQEFAVNTELMEFFCTENNRDPPHMVGK